MTSMLLTVQKLPLLVHATALAASIAGFVWLKARLDASYAASKHPVPYAKGQTSFNAESIMGWYKSMSDAGTLGVYWKTQFIDFGFLFTLGLTGLLAGLLVARIVRSGSFAAKAATFAAVIIPLGALSDAMENLVSFVMLSRPDAIPQWLAFIYSSFAAFKFACITTGMAALLLAALAGAAGRLFGKPNIG